ncbi:MAG TPA: ABC-2 family transporter protein [Candidatus Dojkabacteria bacterium]|nr:ABC-2 family transporter protein [Candidatus Dojkabacteria bacterium]
MKDRKQNKKILSKEIQMYFKKEFQYKGQMIAWIIADAIKIIGLCFIWLAASNSRGIGDQAYIVSYYILIMFVSKFTSDYTLEHGIRNILDGKFSNFLVKPYSYLLEYLGTNIGGNILRIILFLPSFIGAIYFAKANNLWIVDFNPYLIFLSLIAIIIGFCISFLLGNIVCLLAVKIKEMDGIRILYYNIASILSGEFIPSIFLPEIGKFVFEVLPFRYTLSFPVELILGRVNDYEKKLGFIFALIWMLILFILYKIISKKAIKKYEAEGI